MFICNTCLNKSFQNGPSLCRSIGPCEFCNSVSDCNDIQSGRLIHKQKKVDVTGVSIQKKPFDIKDIKVKTNAVIAMAEVLGSPALDYMTGALDKEFKRLHKYKRMNSKRRNEMHVWKSSFLTNKLLEAYKKVMPILIDGYVQPQDRKLMKKILLS